MQYLLLIYIERSQQEPSAAEMETTMAEYVAFSEELVRRGAMAGGERLASDDSATTVRVRNGNRVVTDGPFAETKEWLGGYYVIEAASLDHALEAAAMCPGAKYGAVEIRPVVSMAVPT